MAILNYSPPMSPFLEILYRDEDIIVLNKPSGLLSVPGKAPQHTDSLQYRVQTVWPNSGVVHRLDMMTSGLMVMAMHKTSLRELNKAFASRTPDKTYVARVAGHMTDDEGSMDYPLICDWPNRPKQKVCYDTGKPSLTYYRVLERSSTDGQPWTRVELIPVTGRSHQLRVHLMTLGYPILGDRLYAPDDIIQQAERLQLHAFQLSIDHPVTHERLQFESRPDF